MCERERANEAATDNQKTQNDIYKFISMYYIYLGSMAFISFILSPLSLCME